MPDFNVRSDSVNVEQIMEQIRARIREKRGVDYTEQQIRELAAVKLEKFLDPRGVRSDLLEQFRRAQPPPSDRPNFSFDQETLFDTHRAPLRWLRRLLRPILKLFFNPDPLIQVLHLQSGLNTLNAEREAARYAMDHLHYELIHNLVVEATRAGIEVKNLKMRVESLSGRLEFNERRARALESVVAYKPSSEDRAQAPAPARRPEPESVFGDRQATSTSSGQAASTSSGQGGGGPEGPGQRSRRRRRRRGRRGGASAVSVMGAGQPPPSTGSGQVPTGGTEQAFTADSHPAGPHDDPSSADSDEGGSPVGSHESDDQQ